MTEDPRISEIRAVLADPMLDEAMMLDAVNAILDRPVPAQQPVDWPAVAEAFADEIAELNPPAAQVFFPGEVIPGGMATQNEHGTITRCAMSLQSSTIEVRLRTAAHPLSPEEWQAAVDRARAEREVSP